MTAANYAPSLRLVLIHEGGFVCDPQDPGGATCKGVTQAVYDDWRIGEGLEKRSVKLVNDYEVGKIYRSLYWDRICGDALPVGVDYCCFDFAVNSGPARAARYLQRAVGAFQDGDIGPATLASVNSSHIPDVIDNVCDARLSFLKQLPIFDRFGHGWTTRVQDVRAKAKEMAA
jgi:lysozyme family protein